MCSQQFWTIREKRATNQLLVLRLQKQGRSQPWSLLTALGVLRRADHLRFLPALTINPHLPAPPVKGPHHPLSWQEQGHRFLFSLTFNAAGIPIKPSLNFFSALVNYFCWLKNPRIQVGNKEVEVLVTHSCQTLCDPRDCTLSGSSVHGILQARILEWVAISVSKGSIQPRDQIWVSCIAGRFFTLWAPREVVVGNIHQGKPTHRYVMTYYVPTKMEIFVTWDNLDECREYYAKWIKTDRERCGSIM